jgi:hypothetical protein
VHVWRRVALLAVAVVVHGVGVREHAPGAAHAHVGGHGGLGVPAGSGVQAVLKAAATSGSIIGIYCSCLDLRCVAHGVDAAAPDERGWPRLRGACISRSGLPSSFVSTSDSFRGASQCHRHLFLNNNTQLRSVSVFCCACMRAGSGFVSRSTAQRGAFGSRTGSGSGSGLHSGHGSGLHSGCGSGRLCIQVHM